MRAAPAVDALLADGRGARWLIVALHLVAMAVLLAWAAAWWLPVLPGTSSMVVPPAAWGLAAAGLLLAGGLGHWQARCLLPAPPQRLRWDGQAWQLLGHGRGGLEAAACPLAAVAVQLDLGRHLLLQLQLLAPPQRPCWAVASARAAGPDWHGLRVALQHHAGARNAAGAPDDVPAADR